MPPELPLFIATKEKTKPQYDNVMQDARSTVNNLYAPMGGFVVANTPNDLAVLHTSGAAECGDNFQDRLISALKSLYPRAFCTHVGGAIYIPIRYRAAFFDSHEKGFFERVAHWHKGLSLVG